MSKQYDPWLRNPFHATGLSLFFFYTTAQKIKFSIKDFFS